MRPKPLIAQPTLAAQFWSNVVQSGFKPAFVSMDAGRLSEHTWHDVASWVDQAIHDIKQADLPVNACVASQLPNSLEWIAIDLACQTLGMLHLAIDPREPPSRVQAILAASNAQILFDLSTAIAASGRVTPQVNARRWLQRARRVDSNSPAQLLMTSGTSGHPKLVTLSHRNLVSNAWAKLTAAPQYSHDLRLNLLPFSHAYARTCELSTWLISRCRLAVANTWEQVREHAPQLQPSLINLVPYLAEEAARTLTAERQAFGNNLRLLQVGGAGLPDALWETLNGIGLPPLQGYGLTEASPVVCSNRAGEQRRGTIGPPVAGVELRVDDRGVLWTRGPHVMLGYWNNPLATADIIQQGWLCTGDLVEESDTGLRIVGRLSQQIVLSTGYKVSPEVIETRLQAIPSIAQAVVLGEGQSHITAWVWPTDDIRKSGDELAHWFTTLAKSLAESSGDLPHYALPRNFGVLPMRLSVEAGTLSRKGVPMRDKIAMQVKQLQLEQ